MCEYIILEDFKMDKYIYDENNGLWYELQGEYYLPCLSLPPERVWQSKSKLFMNVVCCLLTYIGNLYIIDM